MSRRVATARRRLEGTVVAAVLVPLLTVAAVLGVDPDEPAGEAGSGLGPASEAPLDAVDLGCPTAGPAPRLLVAAPGAPGEAPEGAGAGDPDGAVSVDVVGTPGGSDDTRLALPAAGAGEDAAPVRRVRARGAAAVVRGRGDLAPGLLALRTAGGASGAAAVACPAPAPEQWFTGVGAGATHASVLELVNPDGGPAVADVTVLDATGAADVPALRGLTVPGRETLRLDLAAVAPRRGELALRVVVTRGRLATSVLDRVDRLGRGGVRQDWLPAQTAPATDLALPGLLPGAGARTLVVANPGEDEARVQVEVVTPDSTLAPVGLEPVVVQPGTVEVVDLSAVLARESEAGAVALRLTSAEPVTATLRQAVDDGLAHAVGAPLVTAAATLLPQGRSRLVLLPGRTVATATVRAWTADGAALPPRRRELDPGRAAVVRLPARAARVALEVEGTDASGGPARVAAAVVTTGGRGSGAGPGAVVLPLTPAVDRALVPQVGPGLP